MEKTRNADSVEFTDQRCVQHIVMSTVNGRKKTIGQAAVRARLLMKQNSM